MPARRTLRPALFLVLVFVVGTAGVLTGRLIRTRVAGAPTATVTARVPMPLLRAGDVFPDLPLVNDTGEAERTAALIGGTGMVVLFLDLECPPCADTALRWQRAIEEGVIGADQVMAITYQSHEAMAMFREEHGLVYRFFQDADLAFHRGFEVNRFPLEVIVGASGLVHSTRFDSASPVDAERLQGQLTD